MKLVVILGSQRIGGTSTEIEKALNIIKAGTDIDFIRMHETRIDGCNACEKCSNTGLCDIGQNDQFNEVLHKMIEADALLIITPIYSPYPSRLTALMERLLSISYFPYVYNKRARPLKDKPTGIICYGSSKIEDDKQLKVLFQKILMDEYSFFDVSYKFINDESEPGKKYINVIEYAKDIVLKINDMNSLTRVST
jgi:multimeric flavodoxin WrbA